MTDPQTEDEPKLDCCKRQKVGIFCMTCGRQIREQPAHLEILNHCAKQIKMHRSTIRKFEEELKTGNGRNPYCKERIAGSVAAIQKFERWRRGIRDLMEGKV